MTTPLHHSLLSQEPTFHLRSNSSFSTGDLQYPLAGPHLLSPRVKIPLFPWEAPPSAKTTINPDSYPYQSVTPCCAHPIHHQPRPPPWRRPLLWGLLPLPHTRDHQRQHLPQSRPPTNPTMTTPGGQAPFGIGTSALRASGSLIPSTKLRSPRSEPGSLSTMQRYQRNASTRSRWCCWDSWRMARGWWGAYLGRLWTKTASPAQLHIERRCWLHPLRHPPSERWTQTGKIYQAWIQWRPSNVQDDRWRPPSVHQIIPSNPRPFHWATLHLRLKPTWVLQGWPRPPPRDWQHDVPPLWQRCYGWGRVLPGEQEEVEAQVWGVTASTAQYLEAWANLGRVHSTHGQSPDPPKDQGG